MSNIDIYYHTTQDIVITSQYIQGASKKSVISELQLYTTISQVPGHSQRCFCTQNKAEVM